MKIIESKAARIISLVGFICLVSLSLSATSLFNFPSFYQLSTKEQNFTLLISTILFSIPALYVSRALILPTIGRFKKIKNLIFVVILLIFLSVVISISSNYYWSTPIVHNLEICFEADNAASKINIRELNHPVTNHLFPSDSFGSSRYPFPVESGECVSGNVMTFYRRVMRFWNKPGISIVIQGEAPAGRLFVNVNETPSAIVFDSDTEIDGNTIVTINEGFEQGTTLGTPWSQSWFLGIRMLAVLITGGFLSLFFFALSEKIIRFTPKEREQKEPRLFNLGKNLKFRKPKIYHVLLLFTLVYFIVFGIFMVHTDGQPDQSPHRYYSIRFSETWGIPEEDNINNRIITGKPYLAYWIYGAVYTTPSISSSLTSNK